MPQSSTYDARYRGFASGGTRSNQMSGQREAARMVGCYRLAVQCPIRRVAGPCDDFSCDLCSCMPKPPCPEPESCEDLLQNVAAAEAALARSLDAEAEKLGRIIETADDFDVLLEADRAVNRIMEDVIGKEQALYCELQRIVEICGACEPKPKDAGVPGKQDPKAFPGYGS